MKKYLVLILTLVINIPTFSQFSGGDGSVSNPYRITNKADLKDLSDSVGNSPLNNYTTGYNWSKDKHFKVMNDIEDSVKTVVGYTNNMFFIFTNETESFQGDFNGNNKKIILAIDRNTYDVNIYLGLFGAVKNANIYDLIVDGFVNGENWIAGICGSFYGGSISNCINYGSISGSYEVGGICGIYDICESFYGGNISNCINYGNINGEISVGGIVGLANAGYSTSYCSNIGSITAIYGVGGISGYTYENTEYSYCINIGMIKADSIVGGIVGGYNNENKNGNIYNSINSGLIIGKDIIGGIIGRNNGVVKNCINTGTVKGDTKTGCIVGDNENGTVINCHYDTQTCGKEE